MKCFLIRELLPLYEVNECSKETKKIVLEHLETCEDCRGLYEVMHEEVGLKNTMNVEKNSDQEQEFWRKYYGTLLVKGLIIFLLVYAVIIGIKILN